MTGTGVQVGGSETSVAVDVGMTTVGGRVGGGKGFTLESGLTKMTRKIAPMINAAAIRTIARISQMVIFMPFLTSPLLKKEASFCQYI
jgi:hypothetical protein